MACLECDGRLAGQRHPGLAEDKFLRVPSRWRPCGRSRRADPSRPRHQRDRSGSRGGGPAAVRDEQLDRGLARVQAGGQVHSIEARWVGVSVRRNLWRAGEPGPVSFESRPVQRVCVSLDISPRSSGSASATQRNHRCSRDGALRGCSSNGDALLRSDRVPADDGAIDSGEQIAGPPPAPGAGRWQGSLVRRDRPSVMTSALASSAVSNKMEEDTVLSIRWRFRTCRRWRCMLHASRSVGGP